MIKRLIHLVLAAVLAAMIVSCGGGGGDLADGGIGGTGISRGSVSAFGSIVVNGRRFEVQPGDVTINGQPSKSQDDLDIGYVVRVDGGFDDGVAKTVRFDADLIGPVEGAPAALPNGRIEFSVLRQTLHVTATTVLAGVDEPGAIADGDRILASGYRNSSDVLVATHLEVTGVGSDGTEQVVGRVSDPLPGQDRFEIGNLVVNSAEQPDGGDRVRVRGEYEIATSELGAEADGVAGVPALVEARSKIELEGIVDTFRDNAEFSVDGVAVDAGDAEIVDETGASAEDKIAADVEVEVKGRFDAAGTLLAERVEVELEDNVELQAPIVSVSAQDELTFFNQGGLGARVTVQVVEATRLRDSSSRDDGVFSVDELGAGDWVEVDAFEDGSGKVTALQVERFDEPDPGEEEIRVEGIVDTDEPASDRLVILDVSFDTGGASFDGTGDLSGIAPGDIVEVRWTGDGQTLLNPQPVDQVELEEDRTSP